MVNTPLNIREMSAVAGDTIETEDTKSTFAGDNGNTNQDIQPAAGEVWVMTVMAKVTAGGQAGDDMYIYLITDGADTELLDYNQNSATVAAHVNRVVISNDCYIRIQHQGDGVGGARTITYWYQGFKVT